MTRRYLNRSIVELETIYQNSLADESALRRLLHELHHRKTKRAKILLGEVTRRLGQVSPDASPQTLLPAVVVRPGPVAERPVPLPRPQSELPFVVVRHGPQAEVLAVPSQQRRHAAILRYTEPGLGNASDQTPARGRATRITPTKGSDRKVPGKKSHSVPASGAGSS